MSIQNNLSVGEMFALSIFHMTHKQDEVCTAQGTLKINNTALSI